MRYSLGKYSRLRNVYNTGAIDYFCMSVMIWDVIELRYSILAEQVQRKCKYITVFMMSEYDFELSIQPN